VEKERHGRFALVVCKYFIDSREECIVANLSAAEMRSGKMMCFVRHSQRDLHLASVHYARMKKDSPNESK
jgi:hypothetical protein